jgi:hypothetical protein
MSLDDLQAQLRGTLDQQFAALHQKYEEGLAEARRQAAEDAERGVVARLETARADAERDAAVQIERTRAEFEQARTEWEAQLHAVAAAARAEGEQQAAETLEREREEQAQANEQVVAQAVAAARRTAELELESERRRSQNDVEAARQKAKADADAEIQQARTDVDAMRQQAKAALEGARQRAQAEIGGLRQRMQTELAAAQQAAVAAAAKVPATPVAVPGVSAAAFERVLAATRDIDGARTLSQALESLLTHAGATAGRSALFLINGDRLKAWKASGIPDVDVQTVESSIGGKDLLARAIQAGQVTRSSAALPAPPFARLPAEGAGVAVPLMIGGRAVAVLYADSAPNTPRPGSVDTVELLVRHASAIVALRTAMRSLDMLGGAAPGAEESAGGDVSDDQGARRYARLLVSEIKLYNEAAVRDGRQQRDLLRRLGAEIDRAQRLYEERVPPAVGGRHAYFHQELVQTLADGDPALLGHA